jgi:hypothetical protein
MKMSDEPEAGAAYLAALRQSTTPQAAGAAAARAAEVPGFARASGAIPPARNSSIVEKRRSPRYRCQGSAHLRQVDSDVATWATFTDISLHGCYVEATATYPVGVVLNLKLEADGFRIEATGEVRVVYPNLGMGISFRKIAEEDRERLRELVRSASRPSVILKSQMAPHAPSGSPASTLPPVANPGAVLQAMMKFFEDRHMMGREEFLRILRKSQ